MDSTNRGLCEEYEAGEWRQEKEGQVRTINYTMGLTGLFSGKVCKNSIEQVEFPNFIERFIPPIRYIMFSFKADAQKHIERGLCY